MIGRFVCAMQLLCLAACSQEVPYAPPAPAVPSASTAAATAGVLSQPSDSSSAGQNSDSKVFSITFVDKPACSAGAAATVIAKWNVTSLDVTAVSIFVESPANQKKLWVDAGASGAETTGKWVYEKSLFTLQDKETGKVLATRLVEVIPCTR